MSHPLNRGALLGTKVSAVLTSCCGGAIYGLGAGIIGGISDAIIKDRFFPDASKSDQSFYSGILTACILLGAFIGCFIGVDIGNRYGRRVAFRITGLICLVMSILLSVVPSFGLIIFIRTLLGFAVGFATALCPWYVTDAVPANIQGSIGTIFQLNICGFILVAELINYVFHPDASDTNIHIDEWKWKAQFSVSALPGLCLFILSYIMHESPAYIKSVDESQASLTNPSALANPAMSDDINLSQRGSPDSGAVVEKKGWKDLFSYANLKWVFIGLILSSSNQLTGINAVIFFAPKIFTDAGMSNPLVLTIAVVGTWNLLSVFISFALVDRLGRRPLMLGALFVMCLGSGLMSLAYEAFPDHKAVPAIIAIILFVGAFECGPGPLFFLMAVETAEPSLRDPFLKFTQSSCWVFSIMVTFGFPVVNEAMGPAATFLMFSINCAIGLVLIWWKVPEPYKAETDEKDHIVNQPGSDAGEYHAIMNHHNDVHEGDEERF